MTTIVKRSSYLVAALFSAGLLAACGPAIPTAGAAIDAKFGTDFFPEYKQGMKWTYVFTQTSGSESLTGEMSQEVTKIDGDEVTVTVSMSAIGPIPATTKASTASAKARTEYDFSALESMGEDKIKVQGKDYTCAKVKLKANTENSQSFIWVSAGVGIVKTLTSATASGVVSTSTTELKEFKQ